MPQPGSPQPGPSSAWDGYALDNSFMLNTVQQMGEHNLETIDLNVLQGLLYDDDAKKNVLQYSEDIAIFSLNLDNMDIQKDTSLEGEA